MKHEDLIVHSDVVEALGELLDSTVYADGEGSIWIRDGGLDDKEHRLIVEKAESALKQAKEQK